MTKFKNFLLEYSPIVTFYLNIVQNSIYKYFNKIMLLFLVTISIVPTTKLNIIIRILIERMKYIIIWDLNLCEAPLARR
jgi:hypothetical protein